MLLVQQENAGATYRECFVLGKPETVVQIDGSGWGAFTCPLGGLQVWVREDARDDDHK